MTAAAIRAALEVAESEMRGWHIDVMGRRRYVPQFEFPQITASTIAAFLAGAQEAYADQYGEPSPQIAWLQSAVEAAAKGEG